MKTGHDGVPVFFVMSSPHSRKGNVSLAITSCDIVTAHLVRGMVVAMMVGMMVMMGMVVAVMMIARLVMLNVVKHLYR
jgi:hypothetical protein